ncbi:unnamed protein product [Aphanomyces euteiches]|nr:hypothetical protein AeRB84_006321 [Aphanomyces euteiches]
MSGRSVLCHGDLLPYMAQFQGGNYLDMMALSRFVSESHRSIAYLEQNATVSYYNALLVQVIDRFRDIFRPWLEQYGMERLPRLLNVSPATASFLLVQAIVHGEVYQVEWMIGHPSFEHCASYPLIDIAAWAGQLEVLLLLQDHARCTTNAMDVAARDGHLDIIHFLHYNRTEGCTRQAMNLAARFNHMEIVAFLQEHRTEGCTSDGLIWAASHGHVDMVELLLTRYGDTISTPHAMDSACQHGWLNVVECLHGLGQPCTTDAMDYACLNGHFAIVKFLHLHRNEGATTRAMSFAAASGHFEIVKFLRSHHYRVNLKTAVANARKNGHFTLAQFLTDGVDPTIPLQTLALNV